MRREIEVRGIGETVVEQAQPEHVGHFVGPDDAAATRDQIPGAHLEHETEGLEFAFHGRRPAFVADRDAAIAPNCGSDGTPGAAASVVRVEVKTLADASRRVRGHRHQLAPRAGQRLGEPKLRGCTREFGQE